MFGFLGSVPSLVGLICSSVWRGTNTSHPSISFISFRFCCSTAQSIFPLSWTETNCFYHFFSSSKPQGQCLSTWIPRIKPYDQKGMGIKRRDTWITIFSFTSILVKLLQKVLPVTWNIIYFFSLYMRSKAKNNPKLKSETWIAWALRSFSSADCEPVLNC